MLRKPHYIALGLVGLLALVLLNLPSHTAGQLKLAIGSLFLPLFGLTKSGQQLAARAGDAATSRGELIRQNEELRRTNQFLQILGMQADAIRRENDQLREQVRWMKQSPWKLRLANVIARDPGNLWQMVRIDLGSRDGVDIKENLPVLTPKGLVGRISSVGFTSSEVVLVGNPVCKVSAIVEKTGEDGVITGATGPLTTSLVNLSYLTGRNSRPGQNVVTSGMGGIFPPGILVGQTLESPRAEADGSLEVRVKVAADLGRLGTVWVLTK